jgi:hypothetical protein
VRITVRGKKLRIENGRRQLLSATERRAKGRGHQP